jgi:uncharacterized membrane protein
MIKKRIFEVDFFRGIAIVLMVIFHFCFDLNYFEYVKFDIYHGLNWKIFRIIIVSLFLLLVGVSFCLAYKDQIQLKKLKKRLLILGVSSFLISITTYFVFPYSWIYFGIIHFIFFATIFGIPFIHSPKISLIAGILIIILYFFNIIHFKWLYNYLQPLVHLPLKTEDIVRFFPWFGVVLIGIFLYYYLLPKIKISQNVITQKVSFLGKHSLLIYLTHQIVMFGLFQLFYFLNPCIL